MENKIKQLIEKYSREVKDYEKSIDILPFSQCQHLIYKKEQLKEIIKDLEKII